MRYRAPKARIPKVKRGFLPCRRMRLLLRCVSFINVKTRLQDQGGSPSHYDNVTHCRRRTRNGLWRWLFGLVRHGPGTIGNMPSRATIFSVCYLQWDIASGGRAAFGLMLMRSRVWLARRRVSATRSRTSSKLIFAYIEQITDPHLMM